MMSQDIKPVLGHCLCLPGRQETGSLLWPACNIISSLPLSRQTLVKHDLQGRNPHTLWGTLPRLPPTSCCPFGGF